MQNKLKEVFFCRCADHEHQLIIEPTEDWLCVSVSLSDNLSFFKRLKLAIKYIFGYRSRYGMFAEILIDPWEANELINFLGKVDYIGEQDVHSP